MSNVTQLKQPSATIQLYMSPAMQTEFRNILNAMKAEAQEQMQIAGAEEPENENLPDSLDIASKQETITIQMRRLERNALMIRKIHQSLVRIENDEYGYCDDCGGEIGTERLHARPTATLCIACKEAAEKAEHQFKKRAA